MVLMKKLNVIKPVPEIAVSEYEARGFMRVDTPVPSTRGRKKQAEVGAVEEVVTEVSEEVEETE